MRASKYLTRYWFEFETRPLGFGVTAYDREDALQMVRQAVFQGELPPLTCVIEAVDVSKLDRGQVLPNMAPPNRRGIWFPRHYERYFAIGRAL